MMMRKKMLFGTVVLSLAAVLCLAALVSCADREGADRSGAVGNIQNGETEVWFTAPVETAWGTGISEPGIVPQGKPIAQSDLRKIADKALLEKYPALSPEDLSGFEISVSAMDSYRGQRFTVLYKFSLCGMRTNEEYFVELLRSGDTAAVEEVFGCEEGVYSKFAAVCTEERMQAAKDSIDRQTGGRQGSGYYLTIADDGSLAMSMEIIETIPVEEREQETGVCLDHRHLFFSETVCFAP